MLKILMLVFVCQSVESFLIDSRIDVFDATGQILHHLSSRSSLFGPNIHNEGISGHIVYATPADACSPITPAPTELNSQTNWIVLIRRNGCSFVEKVVNAQKAGYVAAIVHSVDSDILIQMSGETGAAGIPSLYVGLTSANILLQYNHSLSHTVMLEGLEINFAKFLWPMILVLVTCSSILLLFTVVKCIVNRIRKYILRVSPPHLRKLPIKKFKKGDRYDTCAICLEEYDSGDRLRVLPCSHTFHQKCIDPWLTKNKRTCPLCKKKAFSRSHSDNHSDSDDSDDHVTQNSSERTPLLSARNTAVGAEGVDYGLPTEDRASRNSRVFDHQSEGGRNDGTRHQLSSGVEVHHDRGGQENVGNERGVVDLHRHATEQQELVDFPLQESGSAQADSHFADGAEGQDHVMNVVEPVSAVARIEINDRQNSIGFDRSGGAIV